MTFQVLRPGPATTVQDGGRPGLLHQGVPRAGAADRRSWALANRLVGNAHGTPALEATLLGPALRFTTRATVAVTGARAPIRLDGRDAAPDSPVHVEPGQVLDVGAMTSGLRCYVAVRGGIEAAGTLGSCSTDTLTGIGPAALAAGDVLTWGAAHGEQPGVDVAPTPGFADEPTLRVVRGPRDALFTPEAFAALLTEPFTVTAECDRVGVRLAGPGLQRTGDEERPSEPLVPGALQVTASGAPILLLVDHPTVGGYPAIAVVADDDLPAAAQLRPGQVIRFTETAFGGG